MAGSSIDQQYQPLGFERQLWAAADKLRGNLDAAEYKHVVLGLVFLKYVSDSFGRHREFLASEVAREDSEYYMPDAESRAEVLEDRDEYVAANVFWVPRGARWEHIKSQAKQYDIGAIIDDAMDALERANPRLQGVLGRWFRDSLPQPGWGSSSVVGWGRVGRGRRCAARVSRGRLRGGRAAG